MKPISMEQLQNNLSMGQQSRLRGYLSQLRADREKVIFDDKVVGLLRQYAFDVATIDSDLEYLDSISDDNGNPFSQSLRESGKLQEAIDQFAAENWTSFRWNRNYQMALKEIRSKLNIRNLTPLTWLNDDEVMSDLPKVTTHSGFSYLLTGKRNKGEYREGILQLLSKSEEAAKIDGSFNKPIMPGTRTQCSGAFDDETGERTYQCKHKTRLVAMVDLFQILSELRYAKPFQQRFAQSRKYAGGKRPNDISIIISGLRNRFRHWYSIDYSSFDQSISDWLIRDVFSIIHDSFKVVDEELWQVIVDDFIEKNYISPFNGIVHSIKGVPSGSMFTQIVDSLVNLIIIQTYLFSIGVCGDMIVMGDDNLLYTSDEIDLDQLSSYVLKNFGIRVNSVKSHSGDRYIDPIFLSRTWTCVGQERNPHVLVSKLAYPERFRVYSKDIGPEMVLYGYILEYMPSMSRLMNVGKFIREHNNLGDEKVWSRVDSRYLPGALRYSLDYLVGSSVTMTALKLNLPGVA